MKEMETVLEHLRKRRVALSALIEAIESYRADLMDPGLETPTPKIGKARRLVSKPKRAAQDVATQCEHTSQSQILCPICGDPFANVRGLGIHTTKKHYGERSLAGSTLGSMRPQ